MRSAKMSILALVLFTSTGLAGVEIVGWDQPPLSVTSEADAVKLVRIALQDSYKTLAGSKHQFAISFVDGAEIGKQFGIEGATAEDMAFVGAHFTRDPADANRYAIYLNRDAIRSEIDKGVAAAGEKFSALPADEQERKLVFALRIQALCLVAHEGTHAVQLERGRVGFGAKGPDGLYKRLAADRYDEFESHFAELSLPKLQKGKLPEQFAAKLREQAIAQVNANYKTLPAKYLVVSKGREVEGKAPFAWPGTVDAKTSFGSFVSELVALGAGAGGAGTSLAAGEAAPEDAGPGSAASDDGELATAQDELLGDPGFELSNDRLITGDRYGQVLAGEPSQGADGTAAAKRGRPVRPR